MSYLQVIPSFPIATLALAHVAFSDPEADTSGKSAIANILATFPLLADANLTTFGMSLCCGCSLISFSFWPILSPQCGQKSHELLCLIMADSPGLDSTKGSGRAQRTGLCAFRASAPINW